MYIVKRYKLINNKHVCSSGNDACGWKRAGMWEFVSVERGRQPLLPPDHHRQGQ